MSASQNKGRADPVIRFIERYCLVPEGSRVGQPMRLEDFQREFIKDVYNNPEITRRAILSLARKNGKTATIAALLLAHLVGPEAEPNSHIISGAMSREQAALVFDHACKMIRQSPELSDVIRIVPSSKKLIGLPRNVEYRAISAEGKTAHGLSPRLAILDEVGQVNGPRSDFIDAITTSQGAHEYPLLIVISTQAPNDSDLLSIWIDDARSSGDPHTVCHLYAAEEEASLSDESAWAAANPALGAFRSRKDVEEQAAQATRMPSYANTFRNLTLNQRISTVSPFISKDQWDACAETPEPMEDVAVWGGLDLSAKTDLTALVLVWEAEGVWQVAPHFWMPEKGIVERSKRDRVAYDVWANQGWLNLTPGATVDYEYVVRQVADILADCGVHGIAYDRWRIDVFRRELEREGLELPMIPFGQGYRDMGPALDTLEGEILNGRLAHGGNPVLKMNALNAVVSQDHIHNRKLDKAKARGRIDGMVALAMAMGVAQREDEPEGPSVYESRGIVTV